ncbi:MAG: XRE family transcriptional regulator, partial [Chitinophagaceae bacterium]
MFEAHNLLEIRELYGISQTDFARKLGITREVVNKMESGKMRVSKRTTARLQRYLLENPIGLNMGDVNILGKSSQDSEKRSSNLPFHKQLLLDKNSSAAYLVPLVGIKAQAGYVKG